MGEIKINKARFILSLIGVGVAVWAMATVLALGSISLAAEEFFQTIAGDRPGVLTFIATTASDPGELAEFGGPEMSKEDEGAAAFSEEIKLVEDADGNRTTKFGAAARATATDLGVSHWSRELQISPEARTSNWSSACSFDDDCFDNSLSLTAIDPVYLEFAAKELVVGRALQDSDARLQMNPVVINEKLWKNLGSPSMQTYPRILVSGDPGLTLTVVGVVKDQTNWE